MEKESSTPLLVSKGHFFDTVPGKGIMKIKKYVVKNIKDAISQMKKDLGKGAYILSQRKVLRKGTFNLSNVEMIEVTAAIDKIKGGKENISSTLLSRTHISSGSSREVQQEKDDVLGKLRPQPSLLPSAASPPAPAPAPASPPGFDGYSQFKDIFFRLFMDLVESGVEKKLAENLVYSLQHRDGAANITDIPQLKRKLFHLLESSISLPAPLNLEEGKRKIVVMVGPTGAGKTTTIAKLSSYFKLMESKKIALLSIDSYRIGADVHLKTYADILDMPFYSVYNEKELRFRIDNLGEFDLLFIDTTGRSPNDKKGLLIMEKHLSGVPREEKEVYLILSASTKSSDLYFIYEKYSLFNPDKLIFSKIDETLSLGNLFNLKMKADIPAAYFTNGQRVPEDIEIAYPDEFARRVFLGYNNNASHKGEGI